MLEPTTEFNVPCHSSARNGRRPPPGLLVSVRNADEARVAFCGGADWIDVKEPSRGPLGAAAPPAIADVAKYVAGRVPVSSAAGELRNESHGNALNAARELGVPFVKLGLSGCGDNRHWVRRWRAAQAATRPAELIAVVYADWRRARSPRPADVLQLAVTARCPALLIDTYDKVAGNLLDAWPEKMLADFVCNAQQAGIVVALAGSLQGARLRQTVERLHPHWIAVRGAVCEAGRNSQVVLERVLAVRQLIDSSRPQCGNFQNARGDST